MARTAPIDPNLSLLLKPIPGNNPCGESLRYTDVYDKIREARREDDETLPQGVWKSKLKKADWDEVNKLCQEALKKRSKDLQVAAWLTEAWLYTDGISGLTRGLELIIELTKTYWEDIHPQITPKGYDLRTLPYEWMNTRLSDEIQYVHISVPSDRASLSSRMIDYTEASRHQLAPKDPQEQENDDNQLSLSQITAGIEHTPTKFYRSIGESCVLALAQMASLEENLHQHMDAEAPSFFHLREKVEALQSFNNKILSTRGGKEQKAEQTKPAQDKEKEESMSDVQPLKTPEITVPGSIENREQAYKLLGEVAAFLEQVEPHSPTPYLIRRAITWGDMNLSEVFSDTMNQDHDISLLLEILKVKKEG